MNCLVVQDLKEILKKVNSDINLYYTGIREIRDFLERRNDVLTKFNNNIDEVLKIVQVGEILKDIRENYITYESICDKEGEVIEFRKVYESKPEELIKDMKMHLIELEEDEYSEEEEIRVVAEELYKYKNTNIFKKLREIERLILEINIITFSNNISNKFIDKLIKFNALEDLIKYKFLNDFCKYNIDVNEFVDELIDIFNDYNGVEVITEVNMFEGMQLFSKWDKESLKIIQENDSEIYFRIIYMLNTLSQLNKNMLDINCIDKQMQIINEFQEKNHYNLK